MFNIFVGGLLVGLSTVAVLHLYFWVYKLLKKGVVED